MKFNDYRVLKAKPPYETSIAITYPVAFHDLLLGVKTAKKQEHDPLIVRYARAQRGLDHKNIVPVLDWEKDRRTGRPFAVTTYVKEGNLLEASARNLSFEQKAEIVFSIIDALKYAGIPHGNLCEENIFAGEEQLMIDNFALCREPQYPSPEGALSEKSDVYALTHCIWGLVTGRPSKYMDSSLREGWWPASLQQLFAKGTAISPYERMSLNEMEEVLHTAMEEYRAHLFGYAVSRDNCLDMAVAHLEEGNVERGEHLLEFAALILENRHAMGELAAYWINSGKTEEAFRLVRDRKFAGLEKLLLETAFIGGAHSRREMIRRLGFESVIDAFISSNPSNYTKVRKRNIASNEFAIAAALNNDAARAAEIFNMLIEAGRGNRDILLNNMGAALAIAGDAGALDYLGKSSIEEARINSALFCFRQREFAQALKHAEQVRHNMKAAAVMAAVMKKLPTKLPRHQHPNPSVLLLTERLSDVFAERGIAASDYEFVA